MKKFRSLVGTLLLCVLLVLTGCSWHGTKVFNYLKTIQFFVGNPTYNGGNYTVSFNVNDDLSYTLSVSDGNSSYDALKNYSGEGTQMEYLGRREESYESTSWGVTSHWTVYTHVIKLPEATVEIDGDKDAFYLLAECTSRNADTFSLGLVIADSTYGESDISNIGRLSYGGYAIKEA